MKYFAQRLKEASTAGGIGVLFIGIGQILKGDLATGVPAVVTSLLAILVPEKSHTHY